MKTILQSLGGMILCLGGIYVIYLFIISLNTTANILFFFLSLALIGGGVFVLVLAGKSDTIILKRASKPERETANTPAVLPPPSEGLSSKLEQNNAMLKDWKKTNDTKNRLRMLEISAAANDE